VSITWPTAETRWRCSQCGNLTRFDVVRSSRVKEFVHLDLAGEPTVEETEVLAEAIDEVRCRWCGSAGTIEMVPRPAIETESSRTE
jgi:DNA-directed RNA polymerase subunit RPC12/RpoP